jgi:hypothetical protein
VVWVRVAEIPDGNPVLAFVGGVLLWNVRSFLQRVLGRYVTKVDILADPASEVTVKR